MVIKDPDKDAYPTVFADWLELKALKDSAKLARVSEIKSLLLSENDNAEENFDPSEFSGSIDYKKLQTEDMEAADADAESFANEVLQEIALREKALGSNYPYKVSDGGHSIVLSDHSSFGSSVYLFCLIISNYAASGLIEKAAPATITNKERDLFQICATICAAGVNSCNATSIGWPRPDRSKFLSKMQTTHKDLHPIVTVRAVALEGAPPKVKDGGIDVLSWKPEADGRGGLKYCMGQAASGEDWKEKSADTEIDAFCNLWFETSPPRPTPQMFIPFCVTADFSPNDNFQVCVEREIDTQARRLGYIYHRHRVPIYADNALTLGQTQLESIDRFDERHKIADWVNEFITNA